LKTTIAGAGAILFSDEQSVAAPVLDTDPFAMVPLGKTGINVSRIAMGTGVKSINRQSNLTRMGNEKAVALIRHAYNCGVRFFDCADTYGSHELVAEALKGISREKYVLNTKIWRYPGGIPESERPDANIVVDRFRKELKTDYIDMICLHAMIDPDWTDEQKRQMDILENLKVKGIIRAHGVSVHSLYALQTCINSPWVDSVHVRLNAYGDKMDSYNPEDTVKIVRQLHEAGKAVIAMKLIGEGKYRNDPARIDATLRFVLGLKSVDMLLVGFDRTEQVMDYAERVRTMLKNMATERS
jgi:aryl-alcohol dehydrogenase-like predicted oxidoreductase